MIYTYSRLLERDHSEYCGIPKDIRALGRLEVYNIEMPQYIREFDEIPSNYACEYRIQVEDYKYRNTSLLEIYPEIIQDGSFYVYQGTSRTNITD